MFILFCLFQNLFPFLRVVGDGFVHADPQPFSWIHEGENDTNLLTPALTSPFMAGLGCFEPAQHLLPSLQGFYLDYGCKFIARQLQRLQSLEGSGFSKTAISFGTGKKILANNGHLWSPSSCSYLSKDTISQSIASFPACLSHRGL